MRGGTNKVQVLTELSGLSSASLFSSLLIQGPLERAQWVGMMETLVYLQEEEEQQEETSSQTF